MKVGRNDVCSCGSGKKYKQCCLKAERQLQTGDFTYARLRAVESRLIPRIRWHSVDAFGKDAIVDAWMDFTDGCSNEDFSDDNPLNMVFMPWFFFNWTIEHEDDRSAAHAPLFTTVAEDFLRAYDESLTSDEKMILQAANRRPYTLCEVLESIPGAGLVLFDLFQSREFEVIEKLASKALRPGEIILCATMAEVEGRLMNIGTGPYPLPPICKKDILSLRQNILELHRRKKFSEKILREEEPTIIGLYLDVLDSLFNPKFDLVNSDGDPLVFHNLKYDIFCSASVAFDALKSMYADDAKEEECIDEDQNGSLFKFPWLRPDDHKKVDDLKPNILGHLTIQGPKLSIHVNSEKRARRAKKEIQKRLGRKCKYITTVIESIEGRLDEHIDASKSKRYGPILEPSKELPPELQAMREEMIRRHWGAWFDNPVPALNGLTPRKASKTKEGRDLLKSLLQHFEYQNEKANEDFLRADVEYLRRELGI